MDDSQLAEALGRGDQAAFGQLYERYADRLYSYAVSYMGNRDLAGDVVQDTFLLALARISQLRDPSKLRPWLYAIARNECLRQVRAQNRTSDIDAAGEVAEMSSAIDSEMSAQDARTLIDSAFEGMNSGDREVLDLALRQDLDNASIAAVLGVTDNNAAAKVSRAKAQLATAVGALLLFKTRATGCAELRTELGGEKAFSPLVRKRIARHTEDCAECARSRKSAIAAIAMVGLPIIAAPVWLRDLFFFGGVGGAVGGGDGVGGGVGGGSGTTASANFAFTMVRAHQLDEDRPQFDSAGWPMAMSNQRRWPAVAAVAGALFLVIAAGTAVYAGIASDPPAGDEAVVSVSATQGLQSVAQTAAGPTPATISPTSEPQTTAEPSPTGSPQTTTSDPKTASPTRSTEPSPTGKGEPDGSPTGGTSPPATVGPTKWIRPSDSIRTRLPVLPVDPPPPPIL